MRRKENGRSEEHRRERAIRQGENTVTRKLLQQVLQRVQPGPDYGAHTMGYKGITDISQCDCWWREVCDAAPTAPVLSPAVPTVIKYQCRLCHTGKNHYKSVTFKGNHTQSKRHQEFWKAYRERAMFDEMSTSATPSTATASTSHPQCSHMTHWVE